jgi:hypothetical protein
MKQAAGSGLVDFHWITWRCISEDRTACFITDCILLALIPFLCSFGSLICMHVKAENGDAARYENKKGSPALK